MAHSATFTLSAASSSRLGTKSWRMAATASSESGQCSSGMVANQGMARPNRPTTPAWPQSHIAQWREASQSDPLDLKIFPRSPSLLFLLASDASLHALTSSLPPPPPPSGSTQRPWSSCSWPSWPSCAGISITKKSSDSKSLSLFGWKGLLLLYTKFWSP